LVIEADVGGNERVQLFLLERHGGIRDRSRTTRP